MCPVMGLSLRNNVNSLRFPGFVDEFPFFGYDMALIFYRMGLEWSSLIFKDVLK